MNSMYIRSCSLVKKLSDFSFLHKYSLVNTVDLTRYTCKISLTLQCLGCFHMGYVTSSMNPQQVNNIFCLAYDFESIFSTTIKRGSEKENYM